MTPTITHAVQNVQQNAQQFNWNAVFSNPFIQYIVSPVVVFGVLIFIIAKIYNFGGFMNKASTALDKIVGLDNKVTKLTEHIGIIKTFLITKGGLDAGLFASESPLQLLPAGLKLLEKTGFKKIYNDNKKWFIDEVKKYKHETIADVDEASFKIMERCRDDNEFANFKEIAFQNGVNLDVLLRALSIYLRDELAKEIFPKIDKKNIKKD